MAVKDKHSITKSICNRNNAKQDLLKHHICLTDSNHDFIFEKIEHKDKIELEINLRDDGNEE